MLLERAGRPPLPEPASPRARSSQAPAPLDAAALVLVLPRVPAFGAALASTAASTAGEGEGKRGAGGGAGKAGRRAEGKWDGKERRGREPPSGTAHPPLLSPLAWRPLGLCPRTLSGLLAPFSVRPPALPPERAEPEPQRSGEPPWEAAVGVCVRVKDAASRSAFAGAGGSGGAVGSGSGGDGGGGFRSPAAKMLKVTVPSCSGSTASVDRAAGNLVPDYWIDGSKRDALSDFFEVESELGR